MPMCEFGEAVLVGDAIFLALQRAQIMIVRRLSDAGEIGAVRSRDQHQRAIVRRVLRQKHGHRQRAHARHPVLDMPGLEIAVPVEFLAPEAGLIVEPRLVDVDVVTEQKARDIRKPRIGREAGPEGFDAYVEVKSIGLPRGLDFPF